jgi:hypothetical protein
LKDFQDHLDRCIFPNYELAQRRDTWEHKLELAEVKELNNLTACRIAASNICQQLSALCDIPPDHRVYINLDRVEPASGDGQQRLLFHLAFTKSSSRNDEFVWIQAEFTAKFDATYSLAQDTSTTIARPAEQTMFCVGSLGMDFGFRIGTNTKVQQLKRFERSQSVMLSDWIRQSYIRPIERFRVARLIAEAVLKFDTTLWIMPDLRSEYIQVLIATSSLETYLGIHLHRTQTNVHTRVSPRLWYGSQMILRSLGRVLLELALKQPVSESSFTRCMVSRWKEDVVAEMGEEYAKVIKFCVDFRSDYILGDESIYDTNMQERFYKYVIKLLQDGERPLQ